jgi:hypothetical protein
VLPLVLNEERIFSFKFWFNGSIQTGMHYRNELFCRLSTYNVQYRAQAYHLACKLARQNVLVVLTSANNETCSLWGSLRAPAVKDLLLNPARLVLPNLVLPLTHLPQAED